MAMGQSIRGRSVAGFQSSLEALVALVPGITKGALEGTFINSLKQDIRAKVQWLCPQGLGQIMANN